MATIENLSPGDRLSGPMVFTVTEVCWDPEVARRAEVALVDCRGNELRLVDYEGAKISIDWKRNHRYRISRCAVQAGGGGYALELSPSKRTEIDSIGPIERTAGILVIGDTHVGRTTHPRTGETIDPIGAFSAAVDYGIEQDVDAVVHVGDIFHDTATAVQAKAVEQRVFDPLAEAGIPFYYVRGNHSAEPGDELLASRDSVQVSRIDTSGISVKSTVRLFGIDHHPEGKLRWHTLEFPNAVSEPVSILILHQTLEQLSGPGRKSVDLYQIQRRFGSQFDSVVSGHHHDARSKKWRGVPVMYAGAAERMSKNVDPVDRVAWLLTVRDEAIAFEQYDIP
ncbi:exonuclease SbcCD subunit D [Saliphagus sp. GCM10025317]